jgi:hypothetical protein
MLRVVAVQKKESAVSREPNRNLHTFVGMKQNGIFQA